MQMDILENAVLTSEPLNEKAYRRLKQAIIQNEIKPGARIYESHLATMFGISRTPVREAINQLISEGLIVNKGKGVNVVLEVSAKDVNELYDLRLIIEKHTIDYIASHYSRINDEPLILILDDLDENMPDYVNQFMKIDEAFHEALVGLVGNDRLLKIYKDLIDQSKVFRKVQAYRRDKVRNAMDVHRRLLSALKDRSYDKAISLITQHIELGRMEALHFYEE